jgi:thioredoxin-dependent peroxiredoxin
MMPKEGAKAPAFDLEGIGHAGGHPQSPLRTRLADLRGKVTVLYFYPRDNTPGCTREAQAFSKRRKELEKLGAVVVGVSKDSLASHEKFREKCDLDLTLLSDPDLAVHKAYGAYGEKTMYGKKVLGTIRSTFVIDGDGKIARVFPSVKVDGHDDAVLEVVKELTAGKAGKAGAAGEKKRDAKAGAARKGSGAR